MASGLNQSRASFEERIVTRFQRQAVHYLPRQPADNDYVEWLAYIQHHGGPTRLLDFTHSFYVAAFFALELAEGDCTVWAINRALLDRHFATESETVEDSWHSPTLIKRKTHVANRCIGQSFGPEQPALPEDSEEAPDPVTDEPNVLAIEPWTLHQRLITQQGLFLFPTQLDISFEENLCKALRTGTTTLPDKPQVPDLLAMIAAFRNEEPEVALVRITLRRSLRSDALRDLERMNITAASLFPGLDGFARSLRSLVHEEAD